MSSEISPEFQSPEPAISFEGSFLVIRVPLTAVAETIDANRDLLQSLGALSANLEPVLELRPEEDDTVLLAGGICQFSAKREEFLIRGTAVPLGAAGLAIIGALAERPGKVVHIARLIDRVYSDEASDQGMYTPGRKKVVQNEVSRIRQKAEKLAPGLGSLTKGMIKTKYKSKHHKVAGYAIAGPNELPLIKG